MEGFSLGPEVKDAIRELSLASKEDLAQKKRQFEEAAKIERIWSSLLEYLNAGWPIHIMQIMEKEASYFGKLRTENGEIIGHLESLYKTSKELSENIRRRFPALIDEACKVNNIEINPESRHPRYYFEGKFLTLEINDQRMTARLIDHEGMLDELPADIDALIKLLQREHKRIFERKFDGKRFLEKLRRNYLAIISKNKLPDGSSIPIRNITRRLGKNEDGFRTDEFIIDLSRLVEKGPFVIDSRKLDLQQTKDTNQGMLLYGQAARGYIGFITFGKAEG